MLLRDAVNMAEVTIVEEIPSPIPAFDGNASTNGFEEEENANSDSSTVAEAKKTKTVDWANDVDIRSQLIKQFGPRNFSASLAIQSKVIMKSGPISNLRAMEYVEEWMEVLEWCAEHPMDKRALVKAFLNGIKPRVLSQELCARNPKTFEQAKVAFIWRVNEHVTSV